MQLFYNKQAKQWEETLPIGNGSLGAMIWGEIEKERLGLNQDSLWSGYHHDKNNYEAAKYLQQSRKLVIEGKYVKAEELIREHMLGEYNEGYLPLGNLDITYHYNENINDSTFPPA